MLLPMINVPIHFVTLKMDTTKIKTESHFIEVESLFEYRIINYPGLSKRNVLLECRTLDGENCCFIVLTINKDNPLTIPALIHKKIGDTDLIKYMANQVVYRI